MDKASVALSATEDNAAAIRELNKKLTAAENKIAAINELNALLMERTACRFVVGTVSGGMTSFGNITSKGNTAVVVVYASTAAAYLLFNGKSVSYSASPLLGVLPEGSGELQINNTRTAYALIIG